MSKEIFECDVGLLLENSITIEQYFVLYYLYTDNYSLLMKYVKKCGKISTVLFKTLVSKGYLADVEDDEFNKETLQLTDKFEATFIKSVGKIDFNACFDEFWKLYPSKVKEGLDERYLRIDKDVCKGLYKKAILQKDGRIDLDQHKLIVQCLVFEANKRKRSESLLYMRNSATWLRNKSWEPYIDEVKKLGGRMLEEEVDPDAI